MKRSNSRDGFTLIEMAITVAIIALLVGGVMAAQAIQRAAVIKGIVSSVTNYITAIGTFEDKYAALPGDMRNAVTYWGTYSGVSTADGTVAACDNLTELSAVVLSATSADLTCNGDGNGQIGFQERFRGVQHLASAGMLAGRYTGLSHLKSSGTWIWGVAGENMPALKGYEPSGLLFYQMDEITTAGGSGWWFANSYGNIIRLGSGNGMTSSGLSGEDAYSVDMKMDDGKPGMGNMLGPRFTQMPTCATSDTPTTALYDVTNKDKTCPIIFLTGLGRSN